MLGHTGSSQTRLANDASCHLCGCSVYVATLCTESPGTQDADTLSMLSPQHKPQHGSHLWSRQSRITESTSQPFQVPWSRLQMRKNLSGHRPFPSMTSSEERYGDQVTLRRSDGRGAREHSNPCALRALEQAVPKLLASVVVSELTVLRERAQLACSSQTLFPGLLKLPCSPKTWFPNGLSPNLK